MPPGKFQSTLPAREATYHYLPRADIRKISIHASREGSDQENPSRYSDSSEFQSTLPAREATTGMTGKGDRMIFQSTLPAREATVTIHMFLPPDKFQSTLPAREATRRRSFFLPGGIISIHASREGSDKRRIAPSPADSRFQSTLPAREATPAFHDLISVPR